LVKPATGRRDRSAQLTILAAAPVVSAELIHVAVFGFLARHTEADSAHRLAARLRNLRAAFLTVRQPGPARTPALSALHCIAHGRIDLILYGSVARPACRHRRTMPIRISSTNEAHHRVCAASRK